jgi:hypothetical protein
MPVTLKCPECGHTVQAEDETPRTCPMCEGTMKKPGYKAKSGPTSSDREAVKTKPKAKPVDDDDEDEPKPKAKAKPAKKEEALSLDDDDEKGGGGNARDGKAAASLEIDPGFKNKALMEQVEDELSRGEVLHWAGRMCPEIARKKARAIRIFGFVFAVLGGLFSAVFFAVAPWFVGLIPLLFVAIGLAVALLVPSAMTKQAARSWYAVTNQRAIVYSASLFGSGGQAETYEPKELRRMRVQKSSVVEGAGDLIFKSTVSTVVHSTGKGTRTSKQVTHHGFLGIENVREVETLVHNILLEGEDRDDDDEDE